MWRLREEAYLLLVGSFLWGQVETPDSLARLFERDANFDIVIGRSFPVLTIPTDTFPLTPLLSGSARIGLAWRWGVGGKASKQWLITLSPLFLFEKATFRATTASVVPGVEVVSQVEYLWFKYRSGAMMLAGGLRFQDWDSQTLFPKWWIEAGFWGAYRVGRSIKYTALQNSRVQRVRIEGNPHLAPAQGGAYTRIGRQWLFMEVYYHILPYFRPGVYGEAPGRRYPSMPRWEVGIGVAL